MAPRLKHLLIGSLRRQHIVGVTLVVAVTMAS